MLMFTDENNRVRFFGILKFGVKISPHFLEGNSRRLTDLIKPTSIQLFRAFQLQTCVQGYIPQLPSCSHSMFFPAFFHIIMQVVPHQAVHGLNEKCAFY